MRITFHQELSNSIQNIDQEKIKQFEHLVNISSRIFIIGNGGSNAIANHIEIDYLKCLEKKTISMSNNGLTTALVNDYDIDSVYANFLIFQKVTESDLVILISSSGNSKNIIRTAEFCHNIAVPFVIMTGFDELNFLRERYKDKAEIEFWVNSKSYGIVEITHEAILHSIVDN